MPYRLVENKQEEPSGIISGFGNLARLGGRTIARAGEAALGLPGDIANAVYGGAIKPVLEKGMEAGILRPAQGIGLPQGLPERLPIPTSTDIKNYVTEPLSGKTLEPRNSYESFWDEAIQTGTQMLIPLGGVAKILKGGTVALPTAGKIGKTLGIAASGLGAKAGVEKITGSPFLGTIAQLITQAAMSTSGTRGKLLKEKKGFYNKAYSNLPENVTFDISPEYKEVQNIISGISKSDKPAKDWLMERLTKLKKIITNPKKANIKDLIALKQDWNEHLPNAPTKKAEDIFRNGIGIANSAIKRYGETNKEFYNPYTIGEELTGAMKSTNLVQKLMAKHPYLQEVASNPFIKHIFFPAVGFGAASLSLPKVIGIGGAALATKEAAKTYQLIVRSPYARKLYKQTIDAAVRNDVKAVAKNLGRLNTEANKLSGSVNETKQGRYRLVS